MKKLQHILLLVLLVIAGQDLVATNYYVSGTYTAGVSMYVTASGTNSATYGKNPATPVATLTYLINTYKAAFSSGDVIYIDYGTYSDQKLDITLATEAGIIFQGAGVGNTIFNGGGGTSSPGNYFMWIRVSNVQLRDFTVTGYQNIGTLVGSAYTTQPGKTGQAITIGDNDTPTAISGVLLFSINVIGNGASNNGGNAGILIASTTTVTIQGSGSMCNLTNSSYSGGIDVFGTNINTTIQDYVLSGDYKTGYTGGGLMISGNNTTKVTVLNSTISNNKATTGGGGIISEGLLEMRDCIIETNTVTTSGYGGGLAVTAGTATLRRCIFRTNSANTGNGGAISAQTSGEFTTDGSWSPPTAWKDITLTVDSCLFTGNTVTSNGTDIYANQAFSRNITINCNNSTFSSATSQLYYNSANGMPTYNLTNCGAPTRNGSVLSTGTISYTANPTPPYPSTGSCNSIIVLPVELLQFEGACKNGKNILQWQTATELDNAFFILEKSDNGTTFNEVARVKGSGNSHTLLSYQYTDVSSQSAYYRLCQVDLNGKKTYLQIIYVAACDNSTFSQIFYNSNTQQLLVHFISSVNGRGQLTVTNMLGQPVLSKTIDVTEGSVNVEENLQLPADVYVVTLEWPGGSLSKKVVAGL